MDRKWNEQVKEVKGWPAAGASSSASTTPTCSRNKSSAIAVKKKYFTFKN